MKCPKCGYQPRNGLNFCPNCGENLSPVLRREKRRRGILIGVLSAGIFVVLAVLVGVLLSRAGGGEAQLSDPTPRNTSAPVPVPKDTAPPVSEPPETTAPATQTTEAAQADGETAPPPTAVAVATEPAATAVAVPEETESAGTGLSLQEQYKLNLFLSNFSEQGFQDCDSATAPDTQLLAFVCLHTKINQFSQIEPISTDTGSYYTVSYDLASRKLQRFFGRTLAEPAEGTAYIYNWDFFYADGRFWFPAAEGDSHSCISIADSITALGDGTYGVTFLIYSVDEFSMGGYMVEDKSYYYLNAPGAASQAGLTYCGSGSAVVRPYNQDGIDSYQLISYDVD